MGSLESNEVVQLVFMLVVLLTTSFVRAHPSNTPRTRRWWGRFLVMVVFLTVAAFFTNLEQYWPESSGAGQALNLGEHLSMLLAAGWAVLVAALGRKEARERAAARGEA